MKAKMGPRFNAKEIMLRAILHPAVWKVLGRPKSKRTEKLHGSRETKNCVSLGPERFDLPEEKLQEARETVSLDSEEVWRFDLPQELVEKVFNKLSHNDLLTCRSVCKTWNACMFSAGLAPACWFPLKTTLVHFLPDGHFLHQALVVYNSKMNTWDKQSLAFLHYGGILGSHTLVASDGGLLCFCDSSWQNFLICNPISKQWRLLHPPSGVLPRFSGRQMIGHPGDYILVGMEVSQENGTYKLVLAGLHPRFGRSRVSRLAFNDGESSRRTLVYDSSIKSWSEAPPVPLSPPQLERGVWCNECPRRCVTCCGKLHWCILESNFGYPVREVVRFDIHKQKWANVEVDNHELDGLVSLAGKVLVMKLEDRIRVSLGHMPDQGLPAFYAGIGSRISPSEWDCTILEVQDAGHAIDLVRRKIPRELLALKRRDNVTSAYGNQYCCVGEGNSLFIMDQIIDGDFNSEWEMVGWRVLYLDVSKRSCTWLPQLTTNVEEKYPLSWWTFQPSLRALV